MGILITVEFHGSEKQKRFGFPIALGKILAPDEELQAIADDITNAKKIALKNAEVERKAAEDKELLENSNNAVRDAEEKMKNIDLKTIFTHKNFRIFKVHQDKTFDAEFKGKYVWAPTDNIHIHHHEKMTEIHTGDIIFHYAEGALVAVSEAVSDCINHYQPLELNGNGWENMGYLVKVRYQRLSNYLSLKPFKNYIISHKNDKYSSFDRNGNACQGYMFDLEYDIAKFIKAEILKMSQPSGVVNVLNRIK